MLLGELQHFEIDQVIIFNRRFKGIIKGWDVIATAKEVEGIVINVIGGRGSQPNLHSIKMCKYLAVALVN